MLRMLHSPKHFRGKDLRITDPSELDTAESKLIHLAQMKSVSVELKTFTAGKRIKNSSKTPTYSPFICPAGINRSTGWIVRLVNTELDTMHSKLLDNRHTLVRLLARSFHHKHFHPGLDYMRSVLNMKYAKLGLRRLLRSIENQGVTCSKRKASTLQPICPIYLSNVSDKNNHPLIIRVLITLDRFTVRFAVALKKDGIFFHLPHHQGCTP